MKIVADDKIPFLKGTLEPFAEVIYLPGKQIARKDLKDADALIIRTRTKCTSELLEDTPVQFIGTATIGFDHIDTQFCEKHKIQWTNAPGCNSSSVQQYIASVLLKISSEFGFSLKDKTIGIVGVGNVGSKVEKFARILGMKVLLCDPPRARKEENSKFTKLKILLRESDIVTIHVPLDFVTEDKTYHLFGQKSFKMMKKGAFYINSSRGEVVDTASVKTVLRSGWLSSAVFDVWENEPDIDLDLMTNAFISTPHIAGYSTDGKANGTAMVVNALSEKFNLPLKNWYPPEVPPPVQPVIEMDVKGKTIEEIISEAIIHTYNISEDEGKLRSSPAGFEKQRDDYPLRREFPAYSISLSNSNKKILKLLEELGFKVVPPSDPGHK